MLINTKRYLIMRMRLLRWAVGDEAITCKACLCSSLSERNVEVVFEGCGWMVCWQPMISNWRVFLTFSVVVFVYVLGKWTIHRMTTPKNVENFQKFCFKLFHLPATNLISSTLMLQPALCIIKHSFTYPHLNFFFSVGMTERRRRQH